MARCLSKGKAGKEGLVDEPTWQRMLVLLQQMNSSLPPQVLLLRVGIHTKWHIRNLPDKL